MTSSYPPNVMGGMPNCPLVEKVNVIFTSQGEIPRANKGETSDMPSPHVVELNATKIMSLSDRFVNN